MAAICAICGSDDDLCYCPACGWRGTVGGCEGDVDGNGGLGCPRCLTVVKTLWDLFAWLDKPAKEKA